MIFIVDAVVEVLGRIDLDPCADPTRTVPARVHYTEADDGLAKRWIGRIFMNPPYGAQVSRWISKLVEGFAAEDVAQAITLLPARTDTAWFRDLRDFPRCFIEGRLRFSDHDNSAPFPSMVVNLGRAARRFQRVFARFGDTYSMADSGDGRALLVESGLPQP